MKKSGLQIVGIFLLLAGVVSCVKNKYHYVDGTPGDGASASSITVDTTSGKIDISRYAQARVFPGLVCSSEPRISQDLIMNLNYNFVSEDLRISVPPAPRFSTGFYAAPGELVTIDIPSGIYSLAVQVGAWTDNLTNVENAPRDPVIYSKSQLSPGRNYVRNLYGGHIYINADVPIAQPVTIRFGNVVKSPDFIYGVTNPTEWQAAIRSSCVPWLELRSPNAIFTVPREACINWNMSDPAGDITAWNDILLKDYYEWMGLSANPAEPIDKAPLLPYRMVMDIKPAVGYGHSGYPIVSYADYNWFNGIKSYMQLSGESNWGWLHELGHNQQQNTYWSWSTLGETSNNLFAFKSSYRYSQINPASWPPKHSALPTSFANAIAFATSTGTKDFDGSDTRINSPFSRLTPFVQIFDKIPANWNYPGQPSGWSLMTELYKKARRSVRISSNDLIKHDFVYETISDMTRYDWRLFFEAWGITLSNIATAKMAAKYPIMAKEIWKYNPLTRTGGDTEIDFYNRANWVVSASSWATNEGTNGYIANAFDGLLTTYWHSNYGTGSGPVTPPYEIVVDMKAPIPIKGFIASLRQSGTSVATAVKNIRVDISNDKVTWTPASFASGTIPGGFTMSLVQGLQSFQLSNVVNARYFRYRIESASDNNGSSASSALSEINIIKP